MTRAKIFSKINEFFNSKLLFKLIIIIFIIEALWIALSASYPQAFDENFHFGLIKIYSHFWTPFLSSQPANGNAFGAVARDPSYLYHYLMSFPYRIFAHFFHNQVAQIIYLRIINIILFSIGLIFFYKIMLKTNLSKAFTNTSMLIFILIPIVPQLAGQINYDNLVFLETGLVCLLTLKAIDQLKNRVVDPKNIFSIIIISILSSITKFEFMPIFLAIAIYLIFIALKSFNYSILNILKNLQKNWQITSTVAKTLIVIFMIISLSLFIQRDGYNLIAYHTINPRCNKILSNTDCKSYSVWYHDYISHQLVTTHAINPKTNIIIYLGEWLYWIWYRLFFAVSGPVTDFANYPPLPLPSAGFIIITLVSLLAFIKLRAKLFNINNYVNLIILIILIYLTALIYEGWKTYQYTGVLELMNGRYLIPILLLGAIVAGHGINKLLTNHKLIKYGLTLIVILFFLQGGGILTFISRSNSDWLWNNQTIKKINKTAKHITKPIIVQGGKTYRSNIWFL